MVRRCSLDPGSANADTTLRLERLVDRHAVGVGQPVGHVGEADDGVEIV
jgi:hypothetical protein